MAGFDDHRCYGLLEKKPREVWPMQVEQLDLPNRTAPFDAWVAKTDRVNH